MKRALFTWYWHTFVLQADRCLCRVGLGRVCSYVERQVLGIPAEKK